MNLGCDTSLELECGRATLLTSVGPPRLGRPLVGVRSFSAAQLRVPRRGDGPAHAETPAEVTKQSHNRIRGYVLRVLKGVLLLCIIQSPFSIMRS